MSLPPRHHLVAVTLVGAAGENESFAATSVLGVVEATVILAAFAAFGRLLGLRSARA